MKKIKIIKETEKCKVGEIVNCSEKSAKSYIEQGYAEYVEEPKTLIPNVLKRNEFRFIKVRSSEKKPLEQEWQKTNNYRHDDISFMQHIVTGGNYGVLCGEGNLAVIDVELDSIELKEKIEKELPKTFMVKTGSGGFHYYFIIEDLEKKIVMTDDNNKHWGEVQFKGSQVVGAGSIHPNGEEYKAINNELIMRINKKTLLECIKPFCKTGQSFEKYHVESEDIEPLIKTIVENWNKGDRQETCLSVAGFLRKRKRLGIEKVKSIVGEICKRTEDKEVGMRLRAVDETFKKDEKDIKGISGLEFLKEDIKEKQSFTYFDEKGNEKVNLDEVSDYLIEEFNPKTIWGTKSETIYTYDGKIYIPDGRKRLKVRVEELLGSFAKTNVVNEIVEKIKRKTSIDRELFDNIDYNLIPLENGVYNLKTKELNVHSPENHFTFIIPQEYNLNSNCPIFDKFIEETFYPEDIPVIQEWFGFTLFREYLIKKAIVFLGEKDTGKTVILETLINFIGEMNKTGIPLQKISSSNDFTKLSLKGKHLNAYDDLSSQDINDGGNFKVATGGGTISGEEKFGDYMQFRSFAKQTFCANKMPPVKDNEDPAYFDRFIIIQCDNVPDKMDLYLKKKISEKNEMSGILNWALEGLHRLLQKGRFSYSKTPEETKEIMEMSGNPYVAFANDCLDEVQGERISKEDMHKYYTKWAKEKKRKCVTIEQLGRNLSKNIYYISNKRIGNKRFWENVQIKLNWRDN